MDGIDPLVWPAYRFRTLETRVVVVNQDEIENEGETSVSEIWQKVRVGYFMKLTSLVSKSEIQRIGKLIFAGG